MNTQINQQDFRILFTELPGLYLILSPDLVILAVSQEYEQANMVSSELLVGRKLQDAMPGYAVTQLDGRPNENLNSLYLALQHKTAQAIAIQRRDVAREDGTLEERYWSVVNKPVLNSDNQVAYILHKVEDVSQLASIQDEIHAKYKVIDELNATTVIQEAELIYRLKELQKINLSLENQIRRQAVALDKANRDIVDYQYALNVADIIVTTDSDGIIEYVNDNFCAISGYSRKELLGKDHRILNSGHHSKQFMRNLWATIRSGKIWKGEICNRSKNGSRYWVSTTIFPFLDNDNKAIRYLSVHSDITDQKGKTEALALSEEKYRTIFSNSLLSIFTSDMQELKIIDVNDKGAELFGYSSKTEFLENYTTSLIGEDLERRSGIIEQLKKDKVFSAMPFMMRRKDGAVFWASVFSKLNDSQTLAYTFMLDITQQVRFTEELEEKVMERTLALTESLSREKALNEMKSQFIGVVSHEFRTPLATILSSATLLKTAIVNKCEQKGLKQVARIASAVNNLTCILNDFLTIEKLRKGVFSAESQIISLPMFLKNLTGEIDGLLRAKNQRLKYSHHGHRKITASSTIVKNIVLNLLSNASKYSDDGSEITLESSVDDTWAKITVRDNGIGIPAAQHEKVFSEFFRGTNVKNIPGTGLGLSIVRKYVTLLGGSITFESSVGQGTTFTVELPHN